MSHLQLVTVECVFTFATQLCRKAIDEMTTGAFGGREQIGKLAAQVVKWAVLYCSLAWLLGRGWSQKPAGEQLARGHSRKFWCRSSVVIIAGRLCSMEFYANTNRCKSNGLYLMVKITETKKKLALVMWIQSYSHHWNLRSFTVISWSCFLGNTIWSCIMLWGHHYGVLLVRTPRSTRLSP